MCILCHITAETFLVDIFFIYKLIIERIDLIKTVLYITWIAVTFFICTFHLWINCNGSDRSVVIVERSAHDRSSVHLFTADCIVCHNRSLCIY